MSTVNHDENDSPIAGHTVSHRPDRIRPIFVILNSKSGNDNAKEVVTLIDQKLRELGREFSVTLVENPAELTEVTQSVLARAQESNGILVASGGDGTINCIMQTICGSGIPIGIIPQGTFNLFARSHNIPENLPDALDVLIEGRYESVQLGRINNRIFLVNASLGLYPELLEDREEFNRHYGRNRTTALFAGAISLLKNFRALHLKLHTKDAIRELLTYTLFISNNRLQLDQIGISDSDMLDKGKLAAIMLRPVGRLQMLKLVLNTALTQLSDNDNVLNFYFENVVVEHGRFSRRRLKVAVDGEIFTMRLPLQISSNNRINLIKPIAPPPARD